MRKGDIMNNNNKNKTLKWKSCKLTICKKTKRSDVLLYVSNMFKSNADVFISYSNRRAGPHHVQKYLLKKKVYLKLNWGSARVKQMQYCSSKLHRQRHINTEKFVLDSLVATPESINSDEVYLTLVEIFLKSTVEFVLCNWWRKSQVSLFCTYITASTVSRQTWKNMNYKNNLNLVFWGQILWPSPNKLQAC